ncbi:hypothetical protein [Steroidobacter cummioxidans]|uniref:hypothetical protein n=1 Tax=Steroidobacter cummioxidans TaxID=1803913 RepID=UPI000E31A928|nr:hypothetical protein [Steroidobacter cummioxidans]
MKFESVVAKRIDSTYRGGEPRSSAWQKMRFNLAQEFVIGGYRPASSDSIDSLPSPFSVRDIDRQCGQDEIFNNNITEARITSPILLVIARLFVTVQARVHWKANKGLVA